LGRGGVGRFRGKVKLEWFVDMEREERDGKIGRGEEGM
jgi:hypothetical protein